jgi:hypothetical protein
MAVTGEQSLSGVMLLALAKIEQLWLKILADNNIKHINDKIFLIYYAVLINLLTHNSIYLIQFILSPYLSRIAE